MGSDMFNFVKQYFMCVYLFVNITMFDHYSVISVSMFVLGKPFENPQGKPIFIICTRGVHRIGLTPFNPTVYKTSWPESDPIRDTSIVVQSDPIRTRGLESDPIQSDPEKNS